MLQNIRHLKFDFQQSLKFTSYASELSEKRIRLHQTNESVVHQVRFVLKCLVEIRQLAAAKLSEKKVDPWELDSDQSGLNQSKSTESSSTQKPFRMAILLSDIFPETNEALCCAILHNLLWENVSETQLLSLNQIEIISRRTDLHDRVLPPKYASIKVSWNFTDPNYISQFDFVVLACTSMHAPMVTELFAQQCCPQTIMMPVVSGVLMARLRSLLKSELVIQPRFDRSQNKGSECQNVYTGFDSQVGNSGHDDCCRKTRDPRPRSTYSSVYKLLS